MFKKSTLLTENQSLEEIVYDLMEFKNRQKRGVDRYADYREKKEANGKNNLRKYAMKQRNITKVIKMEMSKKVRPINVF